jgi:hypothetical protein
VVTDLECDVSDCQLDIDLACSRIRSLRKGWLNKANSGHAGNRPFHKWNVQPGI